MAIGKVVYLSVYFAAILISPMQTALSQTGTWEAQYDAGMQAFADRRYSDAEDHYQLALADAKDFDEADPRLAETVYRLGILYYVQDRYEEAEPLLQRAVDLRRAESPTQRTGLVDAMLQLAVLYRATRRIAAADAMFNEALSIAQDSPNPERAVIATIHHNLGMLYSRDGRIADAKSQFLHAVSAFGDASAEGRPILGFSLLYLGQIYEVESRFSEAEAQYTQAITVFDESTELDNPNLASALASALEGYSRVLRELDRRRDARQAEDRAKAIRRQIAP